MTDTAITTSPLPPATNNKNDSNNSSFSRIPSHLEQVLHVCAEHKKPRKLLNTLQMIRRNNLTKNNSNNSSNCQQQQQQQQQRSQQLLGMIFFAKIEKLKYISKLLDKEGVPFVEFHGQLSNKIRQSNLQTFSCGKKPLLLTTDIAARGMDIPFVHFVIQYDFPSNLQQYIHRCGRAGRRRRQCTNDTSATTTTITSQTEKEATIYSFFTRNLKPMASDLIQLLEANNAWVDPNLRELAAATNHDQEDYHPKATITKSASKPISAKNNNHPIKPASTDSRKNNNNSNNNKKKDEERIHDQFSDHGLDDNDNDDDEFANLIAPNRIVLKRASHVSDASSSSSSSSCSDED